MNGRLTEDNFVPPISLIEHKYDIRRVDIFFYWRYKECKCIYACLNLHVGYICTVIISTLRH